jgi:hypothetical protein
MKKTSHSKHCLFLSAMAALFVFTNNAWASDPIVERLNVLYPNGFIDITTGVGWTCQSCHVNEIPIPPIADSTLKPNFQEAYNADTVNLTGLVNLIQGCPAGSTVNPAQPWVCDGATSTPIPLPSPIPVPTGPAACDDDSNASVCLKLVNQYGSIGSDESSEEMTDRYMVKCGKKTKALRISVSDLAPENPAKISIQAFKGFAKSPLSTDSIDGDANYSRAVRLAQGSGTYLVKVKKSASAVAGAEIYDAQIMCVSTQQVQVNSAISIKENQ